MRFSCGTILVTFALIVFADLVKSEVETVSTVDEFEEKLLKSSDVSVILMTMGEKDNEAKMKGVDKEECTRAEGLLDEIEQGLRPHGIKVYKGDYEQLSAVVSEFHVRKRMLPLALVFLTRARNAAFVKIVEVDFVKDHVLELLKENKNPISADGKYSKVTLQLGGGDL